MSCGVDVGVDVLGVCLGGCQEEVERAGAGVWGAHRRRLSAHGGLLVRQKIVAVVAVMRRGGRPR